MPINPFAKNIATNEESMIISSAIREPIIKLTGVNCKNIRLLNAIRIEVREFKTMLSPNNIGKMKAPIIIIIGIVSIFLLSSNCFFVIIKLKIYSNIAAKKNVLDLV
jgi:hypothetical protein